jgi:hypothetical protein
VYPNGAEQLALPLVVIMMVIVAMMMIMIMVVVVVMVMIMVMIAVVGLVVVMIMIAVVGVVMIATMAVITVITGLPTWRPSGTGAIGFGRAEAVPWTAHVPAPVVPLAALRKAPIVPRPAFVLTPIVPLAALRHAPIIPGAAALRRGGRRANGAGQQKAGQGQCGDISFSRHLDPSFPVSRGLPVLIRLKT